MNISGSESALRHPVRGRVRGQPVQRPGGQREGDLQGDQQPRPLPRRGGLRQAGMLQSIRKFYQVYIVNSIFFNFMITHNVFSSRK